MKKKKEINFEEMFKNKKIPILTLDSRWHELFPEYDKPTHIKALENKLNSLLRNQGKEVNDIKDLKRLKKKLMDQIINNMDVASGSEAASKLKAKKLEKSQQLIGEINDKLNSSSDALTNLPYDIKRANEELMVESMKVCYNRLNSTQRELDELDVWIKQMREELKKRVLRKQDIETQNTMIYSYMHNILGAEVMEIFDRKEFDYDN